MERVYGDVTEQLIKLDDRGYNPVPVWESFTRKYVHKHYDSMVTSIGSASAYKSWYETRAKVFERYVDLYYPIDKQRLNNIDVDYEELK